MHEVLFSGVIDGAGDLFGVVWEQVLYLATWEEKVLFLVTSRGGIILEPAEKIHD